MGKLPLDRAARAICAISEDLSKNRTEEALFEAVERNLTEDSEANKIIYESAHLTLLMMRSGTTKCSKA